MSLTYVPLEKRSKRKRKEFYASQRKDWGGLNPVTKKTPDLKVYKRKKYEQRYEHEPLFVFYAFTAV